MEIKSAAMSIFTSNPYIKAELSNSIVQVAVYTGARCLSVNSSAGQVSLVNCDVISTNGSNADGSISANNSRQALMYNVQQDNYGLLQTAMSLGKSCLEVQGNYLKVNECNGSSSSQLFRLIQVGYNKNNTGLFAITNARRCVQITEKATLNVGTCQTTKTSVSAFDSFMLTAGTIETSSATGGGSTGTGSGGTAQQSGRSGSNKGLAIGLSIAGAVVGLALVAFAFVAYRRRQVSSQKDDSETAQSNTIPVKRSRNSVIPRMMPRTASMRASKARTGQGESLREASELAIAKAVAGIPSTVGPETLDGGKGKITTSDSESLEGHRSSGSINRDFNRKSTTSTATSGIVGMTTMVDEDATSENFQLEDTMVDGDNYQVSVLMGVAPPMNSVEQSRANSVLFAKPLPDPPIEATVNGDIRSPLQNTSAAEDCANSSPIKLKSADEDLTRPKSMITSSVTAETTARSKRCESIVLFPSDTQHLKVYQPAVGDSRVCKPEESEVSPPGAQPSKLKIANSCDLETAREAEESESSALSMARPHRKESTHANTIKEGSECVVAFTFDRQFPDELEFHVGDLIYVFEIFPDEWAYGVNKTTGQTGVFPKICLKAKE